MFFSHQTGSSIDARLGGRTYDASLDYTPNWWAAVLLAHRLSEGTLIYLDMTQFAYVAKEVVNLRHPCQWSHAYGSGTLGYALPEAIGGKVA